MSGAAGALHSAALRQFGRLPLRVRHFVVGLTSPAYRVGTVAVIVNDDAQLLLARHSYRHGWGLPGGMIGWNEQPEVTVHREVSEELGLTVVSAGPVVIEHRMRPRRIEYYYPLVLAPGVAPSDARAASAEIEAVEWFDVDNLPKLEKEDRITVSVLPKMLAALFPDRFPS
jgi:8-oxo-dGTP diphosphatase